MRKITIEQFVELISYFIDKSIDGQYTEYDQHMWKHASYRLKEYYQYQNSNHAQHDWNKLIEPCMETPMKHITSYLDYQDQKNITSKF